MSRLLRLRHVLSLSFTLPHEATHWAVARLATDDAQIAAEVSGGRALAAWPPLESAVVRFLAHLAPTLFGSLLTVMWAVSGTPVDIWQLPFAVGLALYTIPSPADVRGALGRQTAQTTAS